MLSQLMCNERRGGPWGGTHAPPCGGGRCTVAGIPKRRASVGSCTNTRISYTRLERNSVVSTDFGVNSATDEIKPIHPEKLRPRNASTDTDTCMPSCTEPSSV